MCAVGEDNGKGGGHWGNLEGLKVSMLMPCFSGQVFQVLYHFILFLHVSTPFAPPHLQNSFCSVSNLTFYFLKKHLNQITPWSVRLRIHLSWQEVQPAVNTT